MIKSILLVFLLSIFSLPLLAQSQKGISFQAVIKSPTGELVNKSGLTISAKLLSPNNCILREEEFAGVTINSGYLNIIIGQGSPTGSDPNLTLAKSVDNSTVMNNLVCLNFDGSVNSNLTSYDPSSGNGARKLRISMTLDGLPVVADFTMRAVAYALNSETLDGKVKSDFIQINSSSNLTQSKLEEFIATITSVTGSSVRWNGSNFEPFVPATGAGAAETDPTVQSFAKALPGPGLEIASNKIQVKMSEIQSAASGSWPISVTGSAATASNFSGSLGGDVSGNQTSVKVEKINGVNAATAMAGDDGKFMKFANGSGWQPQFIKLSELKNATGTGSAFNVGTCDASQTLVWSSITDQFGCQNITLTKSRISDFPTLSTVATSGDYNDLLNKPTINSGTVTSVSAAVGTPITIGGTSAAPTVGMAAASTSTNGYLTAADWNLFNSKLSSISYGTTAGTAVEGNDSRVVNAVQSNDARLPASNCASGSFNRWNGTAWVCEADQSSGGGGGSSGLNWNLVNANTAMTINNGYIANSSSLVELAMPATCAVGDQIAVTSIGTGGWKITIPTSGTIITGANFTTSPGPYGYLTGNSSTKKDSIQLLCANSSTWVVLNSHGNVEKNITFMVFTATGANQTFEVPSYVTSLNVKVWGAGGGGPSSSYAASGVNARGGGGGFVSGTINVTGSETLNIVVGKGGGGAPASGAGAPASYGGGGAGGTVTSGEAGAAGGGRSGILRGTTPLAVAGGGGGAGNYNTNAAGGGGGTAPQNANYCANVNGTSATTSAAGNGGAACYGGAGGAGSATGTGGNGGTSSYYGGGGGGGGYYGGGGGGGIGSGGGGSNLVPAGGTGLASTGGNATNTSDSDYTTGIGVGGSEGTTGTAGGDGLIVISW